MLNTEENKKKWVEKIKIILMMGGKSEITFINYRTHINRFLNYYDEKTDFEALNEENILDYIIKNYVKKELASSTTNIAICSIRFLYEVCFKITLNRKLLPTAKLEKIIPTIISKHDFIKIFNDEKNLKHKCFLLLAFCSGLRASEIVSLKIENINATEHKLKILGKGNKERYTILPDITIKVLRLYCKYNHITEKTGFIFKGTRGNNHLSHNYCTEFFDRIKKKYNLPDIIVFHSLRHSFATYFLMNGGDLIVLQTLMGHRNINTTRRYIHFSQNYNHLEGINYV